jgi:hypothetical protein
LRDYLSSVTIKQLLQGEEPYLSTEIIASVSKRGDKSVAAATATAAAAPTPATVAATATAAQTNGFFTDPVTGLSPSAIDALTSRLRAQAIQHKYKKGKNGN